MEFHADLTLPYLPTFQNRPMHGQFVLVELDTPDEAILGRIAALSSDGTAVGGLRARSTTSEPSKRTAQFPRTYASGISGTGSTFGFLEC